MDFILCQEKKKCFGTLLLAQISIFFLGFIISRCDDTMFLYVQMQGKLERVRYRYDTKEN